VNILGIDTSCDDTAAAVVADGRQIRANVVRSQLLIHEPHGGIVPEVASRAHLGDIASVVQEALETASVPLEEIDAIGVTYGPGLSGSLRVGLSYAKGLALARDLSLIPINHLEGHVYANWLVADPERPSPEPRFPLLALIVSGGHTELLLMHAHCRYRLLGSTRDDAAGEAFDKVGRLLGLGFPGGPAIQQAAVAYASATANSAGVPARPELPRAWLRGTSDFSFSGLKTAVWHLLEETSTRRKGGLDDVTRGAIASAFQESVVDVLATKTLAAAQEHGVATVCVCGGVASNQALRARLSESCRVPLYAPPPALCVDNGAMIAAAAYYRHQDAGTGHIDFDGDPLSVDAVAGLALPLS
jgi:tRNA N6-adenosine threonylcarbamoyltransferase